MRGLSLIALFAGAIFIALSPIWVRVSEVGPTASAFWRVCLAVPLLWILFFSLKTKETKTFNTDFPMLLVAGIAFAGDLAFWHWSIQFTSVANSTLLANLASIFVTLAAWLLWKQRPKGLFLAGLAAALSAWPSWCKPVGQFAPLGDGLGVVTAMFYAYPYCKGCAKARDGLADGVTTTITAVNPLRRLPPAKRCCPGPWAGGTAWPGMDFARRLRD
jgi:drug/metabolite transporter (DMT)-like permease